MLQEDIKYELGSLNGKLDQVLTRLDEFRENHNDQEKRINGLEGNQKYQWGASSILGVVGAFIVMKLKEHNIL